MVTAIYYHFTQPENVHWWVEALTVLMDLALIGLVANWKK